MIVNYLDADPVDHAAALSKRTRNLAKVYTTLKALEGCVGACEVLADELGPTSFSDPIHGHINECIVACEQLMGACVRQSRFTLQYADLCSEACAMLADICAEAPARTALQCRERCRDCVSIVRHDFLTTTSN